NILISLTMMVMEKTRDIAVLMSMGTRKSQVRRVFIAQGALIGLVGTAIGLVLGYALSWMGGHYHAFALAPEVYSIDYVPFAPRAVDGILVAFVAIATDRKSTRLNSSHLVISYAVFCLKKKKKKKKQTNLIIQKN